ncbi:MAG: type II secretion system F family protein [Patescibacteria group bacterium]|nr:type II secretion system F family protein [Patescibacteria group bacterium]
MAHFAFKAKKPTGEIYSGERDADDRYELYRMMRESGDEVISVQEKRVGKGLHMEITLGGLFGSIKTIEKINLARNLGLMLEAGLALSRALSVIERQSKNKPVKKVLNELIAEIDRGTTFADALSKHPKVFSPLFVSMVHAGEQSGSLSTSLKAVADQMNSSYTLERRIRGAMMYPAVIFLVMIVVAVLMFIFVVPTLMKTFTDLNVPLPISTQIILGASTLIRGQGIWVLLALALASAGLWRWSKKPSGKRALHAVLLRAPVVGPLAHEVNTARTARTLSSLLSAGVDVVESVDITANVVQNVYFKDVLKNAKDAIKRGELMSKIFEANEKLYPVFFAEMLSVGEETGKIGDMLLNVARYYEEDVDQKTKDMSAVIEPILIVIIGAAVGFFAVSMISPIYSLTSAIN